MPHTHCRPLAWHEITPIAITNGAIPPGISALRVVMSVAVLPGVPWREACSRRTQRPMSPRQARPSCITAPRPPPAAAGELLDHAAQEMDVGLAQLGARAISFSARLMLARRSAVRKKSTASSSAIRCSSSWSSSPLVAGRPAGWAACRAGDRRPRLKPFVGHQQHRLGEVEREEVGIDRNADHRVGVDQIVVGQPGALGAEQDADPLAAAQRRARLARAPAPP